MPTDFTVLSFSMYIELYFKLYLCLLYVAYFLGRFSFVSLSVVLRHLGLRFVVLLM